MFYLIIDKDTSFIIARCCKNRENRLIFNFLGHHLPVRGNVIALDMDTMMSTIYAWLENPVTLDDGITLKSDSKIESNILIVDGFLLYTSGPLINVLNHWFRISFPYEECKKRSLFDGVSRARSLSLFALALLQIQL
uniref:Uncharacterized protein n=1 Tax=Seriola lalandi dorsalis TaxID=1841481 RepID=A0A3B4XKU2_SERLL